MSMGDVDVAAASDAENKSDAEAASNDETNSDADADAEPDADIGGDDDGALDSEDAEQDESYAAKQSPKRSVPRIGNVVLIGLMGCGKSTIGHHLSKLLGFGFVDLDRRIEKATGKSIAQMVADEGEGAFREAEQRALKSLDGINGHVIAVGGGAVMDDSSWDMIRRISYPIWVRVPVAELARRVQRSPPGLSSRPLLSDLVGGGRSEEEISGKVAERLSALLGQRQSRYAEATVIFDDGYGTPEASAFALKTMMAHEKLFTFSLDNAPYNRWRL